MKRRNKINEEFKREKILKTKKENQEKIAEDFLDFALPIVGIGREEYEEYKRKVISGEIEIDNKL
jgi:hypothetical protein